MRQTTWLQSLGYQGEMAGEKSEFLSASYYWLLLAIYDKKDELTIEWASPREAVKGNRESRNSGFLRFTLCLGLNSKIWH